MKAKKILLITALFLIVLAPTVFAQGISGLLGDAFRMIWEWLNNDYIVYGITFILFWMCLYAIFHTGVSKIKAFDKKNAKIVALTLAMMGTIGLFWFGKNQGIRETIAQLLRPVWWLAGAALGTIVFFLIYNTFKGTDKSWAKVIGLAAAGFALIFVGWLL